MANHYGKEMQMTDREIWALGVTLDEDAPFTSVEEMLDQIEEECGPEVFGELLIARARYELPEQACH